VSNSDQKEKIQNGFLITFDHRSRLKVLSMRDRGLVFTALFEHYQDGQINPEGECANLSEKAFLVLDAIVGQIDRYLKLGKIRSKAGQLGGAPKGNQNARKTSKFNQIQAKTSNKQAKTTPYVSFPDQTVPDQTVPDVANQNSGGFKGGISDAQKNAAIELLDNSMKN